MPGYTPRSAVNPLDQTVYVDGEPAASGWGREIIHNDRVLHAHIGRAVTNMPVLPLVAAGLPDANRLHSRMITPVFRWQATQGHRWLGFAIRASVQFTFDLTIHPITSRCPRDASIYTEVVVGTGAAATYGGPTKWTSGVATARDNDDFLVPINGGHAEYFRLVFETEPKVDPEGGAVDTGNVSGGGKHSVVDSGFSFLAWLPYVRWIRVRHSANLVTDWHQVAEVDPAGSWVRIADSFKDNEVEWISSFTTATWESFEMSEAVIYNVTAYEMVLTSEDEISGS